MDTIDDYVDEVVRWFDENWKGYPTEQCLWLCEHELEQSCDSDMDVDEILARLRARLESTRNKEMIDCTVPEERGAKVAR